ncbi:cell division protein ZapE [Mangrovibrevibacter kandeliae]|uniref:cell division protein ZapE n=1 Tax=Mangrovibrevibacter kandeliae TaxID=2968473 RepID=UPI0021179C86|nr:cell division protein ZapE [Aurantimonas sp. CSK15Z-1]MCQ8783561.1 cell division protein ZapE [Aurantimonas sp. CSK15Z-1]
MTPEPKPGRARPGHVRAALDRMIAAGDIEADGAQLDLASRLDWLEAALSAASLGVKNSSLGWLFGRAKRPEAVRGLYIWGSVGRGKTMLMDMFFRASSVPAKRRVHFHAFMAEVHERIGAHRAAVKAGTARGDDPMPPVAADIAQSARLLCFDEFAVTDVADAMILSRLFSALFAEGVVLVATSNVAPDGLYKDGLNRPLFLPFVATLKDHADVVRLDAATDYRLIRLGREHLYLTPLGAEARARMDEAWQLLLGTEKERPASLSVKGHIVQVPRAGNGAARFGFEQLLRRPLGAQDFLALAQRFHTILLEDVPVMAEAERNEAKRFIALVDTLYDAGRRILVSAEAPAESLYRGRSGAEAFEFDRTASRLVEMRSDAYLEAAEAAARPEQLA